MKQTIVFIKTLLGKYRHNKAELNELIKAKEAIEEQLRYCKEFKETPTKEEAIEGMALQAMKLSHIPRTITNKFSSQTENIALNYEEEMKPIEVDIRKLEIAWLEAKSQMQRLQDDLTLSDNLMDILEDRKKFMIKHRYINGYTIPELVILHNQTFPIPKEKRTIDQLKQDAEEDMANWYLKVIGK